MGFLLYELESCWEWCGGIYDLILGRGVCFAGKKGTWGFQFYLCHLVKAVEMEAGEETSATQSEYNNRVFSHSFTSLDLKLRYQFAGFHDLKSIKPCSSKGISSSSSTSISSPNDIFWPKSVPKNLSIASGSQLPLSSGAIKFCSFS